MSDLISLKCPGCSRNLEGENNSKVFFCRDCNNSFYVYKNTLKEYPLIYMESRAAQQAQQEMIYFPFWKIASGYKVYDVEQKKEHRDERDFYVPAFFIRNINYFGDIGYFYMQKSVILSPGQRKKIPIFPADRGLKEASKYPLMYLYKYESQKVRGRTFNINTTHKSFAVVLVPFYKTGTGYVDSILSWEYPSGALI